MNIIICDDNKRFVEQIEDFFRKYSEKNLNNFIIYRFYDAETMFEFYRNYTDIDIILLDVVFNHSNGIEVAKKIRKINNRTRIIFVSSFEKYAIQGYGVCADGYLLKPIEYIRFESELQQVIPKVQVKSQKLFFEKTDQGKILINMEDICFIETYGRKTKIHTLNGEFTSHQKMQEYERKLQTGNFYRCHAAYIVNMQFIQRIEENTVVLKNGAEILISKKRKKGFMASFTEYMGTLIG